MLKLKHSSSSSLAARTPVPLPVVSHLIHRTCQTPSHDAAALRPAARAASLVARYRPANLRDFDGKFGVEEQLSELYEDEQRTVRCFQDNSPSVVNVSTSLSTPSGMLPFGMMNVREPSIL